MLHFSTPQVQSRVNQRRIQWIQIEENDVLRPGPTPHSQPETDQIIQV